MDRFVMVTDFILLRLTVVRVNFWLIVPLVHSSECVVDVAGGEEDLSSYKVYPVTTVLGAIVD